MQKLESQSDAILLVGRLFYSSLFLLYGWFKLTGYAGAVGYMTKLGMPVPNLFAILSVVIELGGGLLILIGYQFRWVMLGFALYVLVAALIAHMDFANGAQLINFMKNMGIVGGSLAFAVSGAGAYSVDGRK
jgi:putative oxidoreductase